VGVTRVYLVRLRLRLRRARVRLRRVRVRLRRVRVRARARARVRVRVTRVYLQPGELARDRLGARSEAETEGTRLARTVRHLEYPA